MVFGRQVIAQNSQGAQVNRTRLQQAENHRKTSRQPRRRNPMESLAFTETKAPKAVVEKR
jgi:hypothetical protein